MDKEFRTFGHVDGNGKLSIYNKKEFAEYVSDKFKNTSVELIVKERFYHYGDKLRSYYFAVVVNQIQSAFLSSGVIMAKQEVDQKMRSMFLYYETVDEESGKWEKHIHTLKKAETEVTSKMFIDFIQKCIIWTAQNLDWSVPFPSEDFGTDDMTEHQKNVKKIGVSDNSTF